MSIAAIIENRKITKSGREETIVSKVRTDRKFFHLASSAAISLSFAIVFSCCATVLAGEFSLSKPVLFEGAVDGSAAADVGDGFFVGATDEDNEFRLYDVKGGLSPRKLDVGVEAAVKSALGVEKIKECDLEGAAKIGDLIFWIGSHGRNKNAEEKKERRVLFATKLSGSGKDAKLDSDDALRFR